MNEVAADPPVTPSSPSESSSPDLLSLPADAALNQNTNQPAAVVTSSQNSMTGIHALAAAASATQKIQMATPTPVRIVQNPRVISQPIRIIQPREASPVNVTG